MNQRRRRITGLNALGPLLITGCLITLGTSGFAQDQDIEFPDSSAFHMDQTALDVWNDPDFKKQFAESYMAETDIEPRVTETERELLTEVLELIANDKTDQAVKKINKDRTEATSAVFDFLIGNIYFQQDRFDEALAEYKKAVTLHPKFRRAWRNIGMVHVRQGQLEQAIPALTTVIELGGNDAVTYGLLATAYNTAGNYLSAESAYHMAILLDPSAIDWKLGLARSFFQQERYYETIAVCKRLLEKYPDRADLWLLQAGSYMGLKQPLKAAEIYELVIQLGYANPAILIQLGNIYAQQDLYDMAVNAYLQALQQNPEQVMSHAVKLADTLVTRGALQETKALIEFIQQQYPDQISPQARQNIRKLQARLAVAFGTETEEDVTLLRKIAETNPLDGEALILLGQHSLRTGDKEQAIFYYERAAGMENYEADAKVEHARLLIADHKYEEAISLLKRAQQVKPRQNIQEYLNEVERIARNR